jgi:hypothetical protein
MPGSPTSKRVDLATLVAALDPTLRAPSEVYDFPNGRRFFEIIPPSSEALGTFYMSSDSTSLYSPSDLGKSTFYLTTG